MRYIYLSIILLLSSVSIIAQEEKIYTFYSDVTIEESGMIRVKEEIRIFSKGDVFKRGITRSLPLTRRDIQNNRISIDYSVSEVLMNGSPVNYFTEREGGDLIIYVGDRNIFLDPGFYIYEIYYETAGQIGFYEDYDELSWNVNGISGKMIDSVSSVVRLPTGANIISSHCYTGRFGDKESDCISEINEDGSLTTVVNNLPSNEMLTVSVGFTKGVVNQPAGFETNVFSWFDKNGMAVVSAVFILLLSVYYRITWKKYGVDPPKPVAIPQFSPPDGLSPAAVGMLHKGYFIDDLITASIVNLSVKGYLSIEEIIEKKGLFGIRKDRVFSLTRLNNDYSKLPAEEAVVLRELFYSDDNIRLDGKYDRDVAKMMQNYKKSLNKQFRPVLDEGINIKFHVVPWLGFVLYIIILFYFINNSLMHFEVNRTALFITIPLLSILYIIYAIQIVRPGERKLHYRSNIKGLKMYLDVAEEKRMQFFNPPSVTPEKFEELLPYAIALEMEEVWGEKFEKALLSSAVQPEAYQPAWYRGTYVNAALFGHALNSTLSNTVSHAATQPSSSGGGNWSSGSFGGGFSGMGGGGGSVGGW
ncbi:MAG TPA: DUF2207 domain-containing protein [Fermentimonas caenicola]|jgi:uncharacterized membrane protein YgcG|uniref:Putative membrane protein n=1 Tax=Fermentimonas caenicola TaxID=1562970 RepID=A0A098BZJ4_9BACT|nr:DUF2207 domain-containing protein [Lascolabacillus sp.]MBP6196725.1 DUF2207 domain-containing protein [Fermentimonas sp.]CEA15596.1 putative membrane protein [Fermentimonas caenicola]MCK9500521.1 DUF2207 domain-containing protein [Lascolabacillus sp.]MDD2606261.1 DUF2207 domain-containing protein [Lascolabacillus sp.]MDD3657207.1 DUF2207 domain-containing protein [Lascolabacillus sp.]